MNTIRISTTQTTHQHLAGGLPFTVRVHSAVIAEASGRRACVRAVGFGETEAEAVAMAVKMFREGR